MAKAKTCLAYRHSSMPITPYNPNLTDLNERKKSGRVLALDVGKKRIGLAVSDELGITAQGIETLERTRIREDLAKLKEIAANWNIHRVLVGRPLHMSGAESAQSEYTREFAERVSTHLGLPVIFWDERLTSAEAERTLRQAGATLGPRKKAVDRLAAVLLLESYLENRRMQNDSAPGGNVV